ncbi:hypothetical protein C8R46DRAFT_1228014 [Mycena filopes]|nr:hypothetical protein C8R46DRAFT_1228014 [Mycena filopes]
MSTVQGLAAPPLLRYPRSYALSIPAKLATIGLMTCLCRCQWWLSVNVTEQLTCLFQAVGVANDKTTRLPPAAAPAVTHVRAGHARECTAPSGLYESRGRTSIGFSGPPDAAASPLSLITEAEARHPVLPRGAIPVVTRLRGAHRIGSLACCDAALIGMNWYT